MTDNALAGARARALRCHTQQTKRCAAQATSIVLQRMRARAAAWPIGAAGPPHIVCGRVQGAVRLGGTGTTVARAPDRVSLTFSLSRAAASMAPLPLSAAALSELNALCAAAQRDPTLLHDASLEQLRALLHALGAKLPAQAAASGGAPAAPQGNDDDLRDEECVEPDTPSQEMGPPSGAGEPSEEVRRPQACQRSGRLALGAFYPRPCASWALQRSNSSHLAQAQDAAAAARDAASNAAADGGWTAAIKAYTTAIKVRRKRACLSPPAPPLTPASAASRPCCAGCAVCAAVRQARGVLPEAETAKRRHQGRGRRSGIQPRQRPGAAGARPGAPAAGRVGGCGARPGRGAGHRLL